jgi:proline dehydrogenase
MLLSASALLRRGLLAASHSTALKRSAERYGTRLGARRFVAGTTLDEFAGVARRLGIAGFHTAATILGEGVHSAADSRRVVEAHHALLERIARDGLRATLSVKLTNLGLDVDANLARENLAELLAHAAALGNFIRVDMEESGYVDATLRLYRELRAAGCANLGIVLQAYLRRTAADFAALVPLQVNLRLVKGAYLEPPGIAFPTKREVDERYRQLIAAALPAAAFTAIATHDEAAIEFAIDVARRHAVPPGRFEFEMLYGIRPQLQQRIRDRGYPVRLLTSYGTEWFPYFMRRLAERPANLWFVLGSLAKP